MKSNKTKPSLKKHMANQLAKKLQKQLDRGHQINKTKRETLYSWFNDATINAESQLEVTSNIPEPSL